MAVYKEVEMDIQNISVQFTFHVLLKKREKNLLKERGAFKHGQ